MYISWEAMDYKQYGQLLVIPSVTEYSPHVLPVKAGPALQEPAVCWEQTPADTSLAKSGAVMLEHRGFTEGMGRGGI